jgi:hypothetical protein
MQNNDSLFELIRTVIGPSASGGASPASDAVHETSAGSTALSGAVAQNTSQLSQLQNLLLTHTDVTNQNTQAIAANTTTISQSGAAANIAKTSAGFLGADLLLSPIVTGIMKLFGGGGGGEKATPVYEKFSLPAPVSILAGIGSNGLGSSDYGQNGLPRLTNPPAPNITVQVNALDSRSFLDRSSDIASAVRRAMLESSALNDVVSEL